MLVDGWLWTFMGLMAVGFIILSLRLRKPKSKVKTSLFGAKQIQDWERVYAWRPVQVDGSDWLWLRYYWQRKVYHDFDPEVASQTNFTWQRVTKIEWYLW